MNAEQFLNEALGGNMNISTLKPLAWHEIMESYAQHKIKEEKFTSTNKQSVPCISCVEGVGCVVEGVEKECGEEPCQVTVHRTRL